MAERELSVIAFTENGEKLAKSIKSEYVSPRCSENFSLKEWTREHFADGSALVFIGAVGIAVRAIAPFVRSKATDPAVVVIDEAGRFVIPILSGHLGGANRLSRELAEHIGAVPVITTATDINCCFAVDSWAVRQGLMLIETERIKLVSGKLLKGERIGIFSPFRITGELPENVCLCDEEAADVCVDIRLHENRLNLIAPVLSLGLGCKRGKSASEISETVYSMLDEYGIHPLAVKQAASVSQKSDEQGILQLCAGLGIGISFYTPEELQSTEGCFTVSAFVKDTIGTDNVCERSAVKRSGGELLVRKYAKNGVTAALAAENREFTWEWN